MPLWQAVVLGVVQGLTEFLPISSTAHLLLVQQYWFGRSQDELEKDPITVVIQMGTLLAVFAYYRNDIVIMLRALIGDIVKGYWISSTSVDSRWAKFIILGNVPAGLVGLFLHHELKERFYNAKSIGIVAIVFAVLMFLAEVWSRSRPRRRGEEQLTVYDTLWIG